MTVAIPCAKCGAAFQAGNGRYCPTCRGGFNPGELRIPDTRGMQTTPMNQAARDQMDANGETYDRKASEALERFFSGGRP